MAEYISRTVLEEWGTCIAKRNDKQELIPEIGIHLLPTADVIERSKIDKAIEELRKEIEENHLNVIDYEDGKWIVKDFVYGAIDRLKRNIGE